MFRYLHDTFNRINYASEITQFDGSKCWQLELSPAYVLLKEWIAICFSFKEIAFECWKNVPKEESNINTWKELVDLWDSILGERDWNEYFSFYRNVSFHGSGKITVNTSNNFQLHFVGTKETKNVTFLGLFNQYRKASHFFFLLFAWIVAEV